MADDSEKDAMADIAENSADALVVEPKDTFNIDVDEKEAESASLAVISEEELAVCINVLGKLSDGKANIRIKRFRPLRQQIARVGDEATFLPNKAHMTIKERKTNEKLRKRQRKEQQRAADDKWIAVTSLRKGRSQALQALEAPNLCILDGPCVADNVDVKLPNATLEKMKNCFICRKGFDQLHHFYDQLCEECASVQWTKRHLTATLYGRTAIVTGGRVKIGFHTVLKLLHAQCKVIVTTRFPRDCAERFQAQPDFPDWKHLIVIYGVDFRQVDALERFCDHMNENYKSLDILINNACQTVRRPRAYYQPLVSREAVLDKGATTEQNALVRSYAGQAMSAELSQLQLCADDTTMKVGGHALPGQTDVNGHLVDLRAKHSWVLRLHEIETPEIAEVFCINALAPFILNAQLKPLLMKSPFKRRFIINVSAMEGKFYRYKSPNHPHTNMAKAALNMMTRTSAHDYANDGIYMNSVDTGWINDENPLPKAQAHALATNFQTPLDEVDAAARILNPIFEYCADHNPTPPFGKFIKDYEYTEW
eukprot:GEMP01040479.1.p1 GENE.GEMP01040479.1~~GEMP01040479.1.p1  ORF type:complete len:539 (+),score=123.59 GEMP01040479.1:183-1799(+)